MEEKKWWGLKNPEILNLRAKNNYYAGYYEWNEHRNLLNPFCVRPERPHNFQIPFNEMEGKTLLDIGCGPCPNTISLVHCASVHVLDPLLDFYKGIQPFGWRFFASLLPIGAEKLPFNDNSFQYVYCWNVLDHTQNANKILSEIARVLVTNGQLLLGCDVRDDHGGGVAHPYFWSMEVFESKILKYFEPVIPITLIDENMELLQRQRIEGKLVTWVSRLKKKAVS